MTYLWLNGRRMDSIPLLQDYLKTCNETTQRMICCELLKKYKAGVLVGWLIRQEEAHLGSELMRAKDRVAGSQAPHIYELLEYPLKDLHTALPILAELCKIDISMMQEALDNILTETSSMDSEKFKLIERQPWYKESKETCDLLHEVNCEFVITDINSFFVLADRYHFSEKNNPKQYTVYLCNIGTHFPINNPNRYWNVRLVGCGNPIVRFGSQNRGRTLDMQMHNIFFQNLTLQTQGMILIGSDGRISGVDVR